MATKTGLVQSVGYNRELDIKIPRTRVPKRALPASLRQKMGLKVDKKEIEDEVIYKAGGGVLTTVGSGRDGTFLKMKSGKSMSERASRLAQQKSSGQVYKANLKNLKPKVVNDDQSNNMRSSRKENNQCKQYDNSGFEF